MWFQPSIQQVNREYTAWAKRMGIKQMTLIPEGSKAPNKDLYFYRTLPPKIIGKITYQIYGDRLAFILWKKRQVIVIRNTNVVETFRQQFNYLWRMAKPI